MTHGDRSGTRGASRQHAPDTSRFAALARAAIEKHVPESRTAQAAWDLAPGLIWAAWPREDGCWLALGLRRHLDWMTGEAAISRSRSDPETLPLWTGEESAPAGAGYRIRLGLLLHDQDRWWPAGATPKEESERLEWLVIQLRARATGHFARHPVAG
jgi:hypothetical protein